jgi:glycosyltransferase involved in cell wall biosynthesis
MKIITNGYVGNKITGIGRTLIETIKEISCQRPDIEIVVYANYDNHELINNVFGNNVKINIFHISKNKAIKNLLFSSLIFPFLSLKEKADIVYLPNFTFILFKFKPTIVVIHDMIEFKINDKFSKIRMFYRHFAVPRMAKKSDHIITVSENSKKDIMDICQVSENKISVIYNGVSDSIKKIDNEPRKLNYNYFLYVGTVDYPGKNVYNCILAFKKYIETSQSNIKFVICGMPGKGFKKILELINDKRYKNHIKYLGYVSDKDLFNYYTYALGFVYVSYYEGFGLPVLEAMKFGIPVITSNKSSLPEISDGAAITCDPDDINEICSAYHNIAENKELRNNLIINGYENLKRFSWGKAARNTISIFENLFYYHNSKNMGF